MLSWRQDYLKLLKMDGGLLVVFYQQQGHPLSNGWLNQTEEVLVINYD